MKTKKLVQTVSSFSIITALIGISLHALPVHAANDEIKDLGLAHLLGRNGTGQISVRGEVYAKFKPPRPCRVTQVEDPKSGVPTAVITYFMEVDEADRAAWIRRGFSLTWHEEVGFLNLGKLKIKTSTNGKTYVSRIENRPLGYRNPMICGEFSNTFHPKDILTVGSDSVTIRKVYRCPAIPFVPAPYWSNADKVGTCNFE